MRTRGELRPVLTFEIGTVTSKTGTEPRNEKFGVRAVAGFTALILFLFFVRSPSPVINGEKATFNTPTFAKKRERTLDMLIKDLYSDYMSDSSKVVSNDIFFNF